MLSIRQGVPNAVAYSKTKDIIMDTWIWKMDYCKRNGLPPAQEWAWDKAGKAYESFIKSKKIG